MPESEEVAERMVASETPVAPGPVLDETIGSRFEMGEEIACGGMGAIYRVQDLSLGRELAIKVLLPQFAGNASIMHRFRFEAQITSQLQHPGIVPIHEFATLPDGRPYLAMKLIRGKSLAQLLRNRASPGDELPQYLKIVDQICQAMAYAHSQGVIHRDLKPLNVMVGAFGEVQVMDWGLAKRLSSAVVETSAAASGETHQPEEVDRTAVWATGMDHEQTVAGTVLGTPAYMPPEQARGEVAQLDERSDVFGLGAILCEVLTGGPPYLGSRAAVIALAASGDLSDAFRRLDACGQDTELIGVVKKCLSPHADDRYSDAVAVSEAVSAFQAGMQEKFRQADLARAAAQASEIEARARARAERRARIRAMGLAVATLLLVSGGGAAGFLIYNQNQQKKADRLRVEVEARTAAVALLDQSEAGLREGRPGEVDVTLAQAEKRIDEANQPELRERHARLERELVMFKALDKLALGGGRPPDYRHAFQAYGVDIEHGDPKQLAAEIRASPIHDRLLDSLDGWFKGWVTPDTPEVRRALLNLLREIDGDPLRTSIREALWKGDRTRFRELVSNSDVRTWSPSFALHVGDSHLLSDEDAIRLLKAAYLHNPRYFVLPYAIGHREWRSKPPRYEEAIEHFRIAIALAPNKPDSYAMLARCQIGLGDAADAVETLRLGLARSDSSLLIDRVALELLRHNRTDEARAVFLRALEIAPKSSSDWAKGVASYTEKNYAHASESFKKVIDLDPNNGLAHYNLGLAYYKSGNLDAAKSVFDKSLSLNLNPEIRSTVGIMQAELNDLTTAATLLRDLDPTTISVRSFIKENGIQGLDRLIATFRKLSQDEPRAYQLHYFLGELLAIKGNADGAIDEYRLAVECDPRFAMGQMSLGLALAARGDLKQASDGFRTATTIEPKNAEAHYQLGLTLQKQNDRSGAIASLQTAIKLKPRVAAFHTGLGAVLRDDGKPAQAVEELKTACRCDFNHLESHLLLGELLLQLKDYDGAITVLKRCNEISPKTLEVQLTLGEAGLRKGDVTLAEGAFIRATSLNPRSVTAQIGLGKIWLGKGNIDAASQCFRKAIEIDPKSAGGQYCWGLIQAAKKEWGAAAASFQQAIDLESKNASAHAQLGFAYLELKDRAKGFAALRQATALNPGELDPRVSEWASKRKGGFVERKTDGQLLKVGVQLQDLPDLPTDAVVWLAALPADTEVWLTVESEKWDDKTLAELLGAVTEFRNLHLGINFPSRITDEGFVALARLPHLRGIRLAGGLKITDVGLRRLHGNTNLTQVVLGALGLSDAAIEPLIKNGNCRTIELQHSGATRAILPSIMKNRGLDWLTLRGIPLTRDDLQNFCQLEKLRGLGFNSELITNADISILSALPSLELLELHFPKIDSGVFKHLAKIKSLRWLLLTELNITDAGLEDAAKLQSLTHLIFLDTPLSDGGLEKLKPMKSLVYLKLTGTRVTSEGVKSLKAALPTLNVEWDGRTKPK